MTICADNVWKGRYKQRVSAGKKEEEEEKSLLSDKCGGCDYIPSTVIDSIA